MSAADMPLMPLKGGFDLVRSPQGWIVGRFDALDALQDVTHLVTTRRGLDEHLVRHDRAAAAERVAQALDARGCAWANQVHGADVLTVEGPGCAGEGDALITAAPGTAVMGVSADCLLILLADRTGGPVGVVHASWRGTVQQVAAATVRALRERFGVRPANLEACFCPQAMPCCYEVGDDVRAAATERLADAELYFQPRGGGKWTFNFGAANHAQLLDEGLSPDRIHVSGVCTICRPDWFPSHRARGDAAGRFLAAIARR